MKKRNGKWFLALMLCALLMGGAVCCEQAAAAAGMERDGYAGTEKAGEGQDSYNVTDWQDSIPLDEVESAFRSMQGKESSFSIKGNHAYRRPV